MTVEEMRQELSAFCDSHTICSDCVLCGEKHKCGNGFDFTSREGQFGYMTSEEICMAYLDVFCKIHHSTPTTEEPHIRDSGSRTEFSTGAVRDIQKGKGRCDLMPLNVVATLMNDGVFHSISTFQTCGNPQWLEDSLKIFSEAHQWNIPTMVLEVSKHFEEGAEKYGENNWQKGLPVKCYINSGVRHYLKWLRGDEDERHDRAFCWNIMCAIWTCCHKPELNDYATTKKPTFDPDDFMGEYEEENE